MTGYKILTRYDDIGLKGLTDRARRRFRRRWQPDEISADAPTESLTNLHRLIRVRASRKGPGARRATRLGGEAGSGQYAADWSRK